MNNIKSFIILLLAGFITVSIVSCDQNRVYDKFKDIKGGIWNKSEIMKFEVQIDDTVSYHNFFINVRNSGNYKYCNLYIFLNTIRPDRKVSRDTIDCLLANDMGKWLGKGLGDRKDCRFLLKRGLRFHQKGIYSFELEQAMRVDNLEGIESVGVRIEKIIK
ncbi:MAG: gliding motility lipoprotein GldH [Bacteroidetes bacterium]|nr:gliding motility lipoprotein GldH [Bacteroidota bacterium]